MIQNEIRSLIITELTKQRLKTITGDDVSLIFSTLNTAQWDAFASKILINDAKQLGELILSKIKAEVQTQAASDVDVILADGNISNTELTNLFGGV